MTLLVEDWELQDTGCDLAPHCLKCPFPRCRYDALEEAKEARNREIRRLRCQGASIAELAHHFGLTKRTIHRVMKERSHG